MATGNITEHSPIQQDSKTADDDQLKQMGQNTFEALLTSEQAAEYESTQNQTWGAKRRMAMSALTRSKQQLADAFGVEADGPETLMDMIEEIGAWADHLKAQVEMAEAACARLLIVASAITCARNDASEVNHG